MNFTNIHFFVITDGNKNQLSVKTEKVDFFKILYDFVRLYSIYPFGN